MREGLPEHRALFKVRRPTVSINSISEGDKGISIIQIIVVFRFPLWVKRFFYYGGLNIMKNTKKILILLLALTICFSLFACKDKANNNDDVVKSVTLLVVDINNNELAKYEREVTLQHLSDLFYTLANEENSTFAYDASTSAFGQFVNNITVSQSVGLFPNAGNNEFCAFYHSIEDAKYIDHSINSITYDNKEYHASGYGINGIPLVDNAYYLFTIKTW